MDTETVTTTTVTESEFTDSGVVTTETVTSEYPVFSVESPDPAQTEQEEFEEEIAESIGSLREEVAELRAMLAERSTATPAAPVGTVVEKSDELKDEGEAKTPTESTPRKKRLAGALF